MDLHREEEGYHKRGSQKVLYDLIKESDKIITFQMRLISSFTKRRETSGP